MKTIEDKAKAYAEKHRTVAIGIDMAFDISKQVERAYITGATEALAGQWRTKDDLEGLENGDEVIAAILRTDNTIKYYFPACFFNGKMYDDDGMECLFSIWMRLPEPPKDKSE